MEVKNVSAGKPKIGGAISVGMIGSKLPTDASTALNAAFNNLGYVSEDGLTNANSADTDTVNAWGGDQVLTIQNSKEDTFQFTLIEVLNPEVLKVVYGDDNVTGTLETGITVKANAKEAIAHSYVFDLALRDGALKRIVVPNAKVSEVGDIEYTDDDAVGYETTITALPDAEGNTHYEYILRPAKTGA